MAKKRLNKKVAIIGSILLMFAILVAIGGILYFSRDPEKYLKDGEIAIAQKDYEKGTRSFLKARSLTKDDDSKVIILFKLADAYMEMGRWNNVMGCWSEIVRIDSNNIQARLNRLNYLYIMADTGSNTLWKELSDQTSELLGKIEGKELAKENVSKWIIPQLEDKDMLYGDLKSYLYLLRGRAVLENVIRGATTDPDESLLRATDDLERVRQDQPENVNAYWYLAQAINYKGQLLASRGSSGEIEKAYTQIKEILNEAIKNADSNPAAYVYNLRSKLVFNRIQTMEQLRALEPQYLDVVDRFNNSSLVFASLAEYYQHLGFEAIDKAIAASDKSFELDTENALYALNTAKLNYKKFRHTNDLKYALKAIGQAEEALKLPNAQETDGPHGWAYKMNKVTICSFLADCYVDRALSSDIDEKEKQEWQKKIEAIVYDIEQIYGSGEEPQVVKWKGLLDLVKGDKDVAIRKLYSIYEQLLASGRKDAGVSYRLAKIFDKTDELGAAAEFYRSALGSPGGIGMDIPDAFLDYGDVLIKFRAYNEVLNAIKAYEMSGGSVNERSQGLSITALILSRQFETAKEELAKAEMVDIEKMKLNALLIFSQIRQAQETLAFSKLNEDEQQIGSNKVNTQQIEDELNGYNDSLAKVIKQMLDNYPNEVESGYVITVCNHYISQDRVADAKAFADTYLNKKGFDSNVVFYRRTLDEPDLANITDDRRKEIEQQIIGEIDDPVKRAMNMGVFYQRENNLEKAKIEFKKIIDLDSWNESREITPEQVSAISYIFEIDLFEKDFELAQKVANFVRNHNIDLCDGQFFEARVFIAKEDYKDALLRLDSCLKKRPVFSYGYMLRSKVNSALGNEHASLEDIRKASSLNIINGDIAKDVAIAVYIRNEKLGSSVSSDQKLEARTAIERAMVLNPVDVELRSLYAEYISEDEPDRALSIRQRLQKASPSIENALLLARLATKLGFTEKDKSRQQALFEMAESAYEQARQIEPLNKTVLYNYAEYLDKRGQKEKAKNLIDESDDPKLIWSHYYQSGQIDKAKEMLDKLYNESPKDIDVIKGQLLIGEKLSDVESIRKYSDELLALEDNAENRLFRIRAYLKTGLIKEAEEQLELFKAKYPDNEKVLVLETWLKMSQGQLKKALELAKLNIQKNQDDFTGWRLKGEINLMLGDYVQAISDLKQSKMLNNEPSVRISLAKAYLRGGREDEAITELENTADDPSAPSGAKGMLEQIYLRLGKKQLLQKFYTEMLEKYPESVYWYNKAGAFAVSQENMANAEQLYKKAWDISNKTGIGKSMALDGYLMILVRQKKNSKVLELGRNYIDGELAPIAYFRMAEAQWESGDKKTAIDYCRKAVDKAEVDENYASEMLQKMYALIGAEEVIAICQKKLAANPNSLYANFSMFNISAINGQYNKAIEYIDKCLVIAGSDNLKKSNYIAQKVGVLELAYRKTSDKVYLQKAIREYESLLVEMPNNISVLNNLAYMLADAGEKLDEALKYAKQAYDLMPNNANIMDTYSYVLYKNGKNEQAEEYLQSALQQYEKDSISAPTDVYKHLGMIKEAIGLSAEAVAAYQQALELGAKTMTEEEKEEIRKIVNRLSK